MANPLPDQHSPQNPESVRGNNASPKDSYKSGFTQGHPAGGRPKNSFKTRAQGSQHGGK